MTEFNREQQWARVSAESDIVRPWDILIVGGGATGVGIALDAAVRGYRVCLVERSDFGKGTSTRSTKLVHGGVRYLRQGNIQLVREALHERALLLSNAPHVTHRLPFIIPCVSTFEWIFYGVGMKVYDRLAGKLNIGRSQLLQRKQVFQRLATLDARTCKSGVLYYDGQFDDARLLLNIAQTACERGACLLNYATVVGLEQSNGRITGARVVDGESNSEITIHAKVVINAAGPFCDSIRRMASPSTSQLVAASQGIHLVLPKRFLPGNTAIMVPKTPDGRVIFLIPWHDRVVVGTTDTPIPTATVEPQALQEEINFLLELASRYLVHAPSSTDILSVFTGIRPLVMSGSGKNTASLSRDHTIEATHPGLLTITGGKWTTYRRMAEDCVNKAAETADLPKRSCSTHHLAIHGSSIASANPASYQGGAVKPIGEKVDDSEKGVADLTAEDPLAVYGTDSVEIENLYRQDESLKTPLHARLTITRGQVVWATRFEMARTIDDVLARRTRSLFLDAQASLECASQVAEIMATILGRDRAWVSAEIERFSAIAQHYMPPQTT